MKYDDTRKTRAGEAFNLKFVNKILRNTSLSRTSRILDVGCGTARTSIELAKTRNCKLVALDISQNMCKIARQKSEQSGLFDAEFIVGDSEYLPFKENSFDVAYCYGLLHHLLGISPEAVKSTLTEMRRCSREYVCCIEPNMLNPFYFITTYLWKNFQYLVIDYDRVPYEKPMKEKDIYKLFNELFFRKISSTTCSFLPPFCPAKLINLGLRIESILESTPLRKIGTHIFVISTK